ncbi:hypothetical protein WOLCODRAFT_137023 [Wolfiporia cocos MD-104 SS10]|uniref:Uncharacterized protein n=1 Tax=Wolfiporia cocos (strain MD-104) TaxID=742152 RepID=A0A2H3JFY7_WOLCO|nr:hypothetical protein WOLCODRAFT_137023 [Wolfiporia cocos MD-104 SS10]
MDGRTAGRERATSRILRAQKSATADWAPGARWASTPNSSPLQPHRMPYQPPPGDRPCPSSSGSTSTRCSPVARTVCLPTAVP